MNAEYLGSTGDAPAFKGPYCIDRYSIFQGVLHLSGWLYSPQSEVDRLILQVPGGTEYRIKFDEDSPDLIPVFGGDAGHSRFDRRVAFSDSRTAIIAARLMIYFKDGTSASITHLGSPKDSLMSVFSQRLASRQIPQGDKPQQLLEIGSRARSGIVRKGMLPPGWNYSGFDVLAGPNVDVVGDAHQLSKFYPSDYFDAVMAFSVLEHLFMPWKVMIEINRVMKPGGIGGGHDSSMLATA